MSTIVEVNRLCKLYGKSAAVNEVSFKIQENQIYGLLGRNGAGKTSIMQMITAQMFASSGEIKVFGENPYENNRVLSQICFIKESQKYPDSFRLIDVLDVSAQFYPNWDREYAHSLVEDFLLPLRQRIKKLSRGMLSSVGIIIGLASRAPLTLFDEPYLGLDAVARSLFYNRLIEDFTMHPRTIVLSTHLIDEVSKLLEHVIVIDKGKLIIDEDAEALRGRAFTVVGAAAQIDLFSTNKTVIDRTAFGGLISATFTGTLSAADRKQAQELGLELESISLQQLIVHLTQKNLPKKGVEA